MEIIQDCHGAEIEITRETVESLIAQRDNLRAALAELEPIAHRYGGEHPRHDLLMAATARARKALTT